MAAIFLSGCLEQELLNSCFPLDKRYAAVGAKHTKIDPDWPIAEVFIYESDYDPRMAWNKIGKRARRVVSAPIAEDCDFWS